MPNDRDFDIIRRKLRREERYYTLDEVEALIMNSSKIAGKFSVIEINVNDFNNFNEWWPEFYKKTCLSDDSYGKNFPKTQKRNFSISKYREMTFSSEKHHTVQCNINIAGLTIDSFRLRNVEKSIRAPTKKAYSTVLPINIKKMEDLKKLKVYIPEEKLNFWNLILSWPTTTASTEDVN